MTLASQVRQPPLKVAGLLATGLRAQFFDLFVRVDVAPPGFLNLTAPSPPVDPGSSDDSGQGILYGTSPLEKENEFYWSS